MKYVTLLCAMGMSTSLLVNKMKAAAKKSREELTIVAMAKDAFDAYNGETDVLLIGPQIRHMYDELKEKYEPKGIKVFPMSAVTGQGVKELLYEVNDMLANIGEETTVFAQEYFPESMTGSVDDAYTVTYDEEEDEYVVEGPKIEKMLGYTNLDSEKGFTFFQNFLKDTGILEELEALGIQEGDTVRMYGLSFDYYK